MSTKSAISIEEYFRTSFEGLDREYVDGEIVERTLPDNLHSRTQWRLSGLIWDLSKTLPFHGRTELRSRVRATRVRIPDVSIYAGAEPTERAPTKPPLVAIEILSFFFVKPVSQPPNGDGYLDTGINDEWLLVSNDAARLRLRNRLAKRPPPRPRGTDGAAPRRNWCGQAAHSAATCNA